MCSTTQLSNILPLQNLHPARMKDRTVLLTPSVYFNFHRSERLLSVRQHICPKGGALASQAAHPDEGVPVHLPRLVDVYGRHFYRVVSKHVLRGQLQLLLEREREGGYHPSHGRPAPAPGVAQPYFFHDAAVTWER